MKEKQNHKLSLLQIAAQEGEYIFPRVVAHWLENNSDFSEDGTLCEDLMRAREELKFSKKELKELIFIAMLDEDDVNQTILKRFLYGSKYGLLDLKDVPSPVINRKEIIGIWGNMTQCCEEFEEWLTQEIKNKIKS